MSGANVRSLERVEEFRNGLVGSVDLCMKALDEVQFEARRFLDWIEHEQARYWESMIRRTMEEIAEAKNALNRKRLSKQNVPSIRSRKKRICGSPSSGTRSRWRRSSWSRNTLGFALKLIRNMKVRPGNWQMWLRANRRHRSWQSIASSNP